MVSEKIKANLNVNGELLPFVVDDYTEPYYRNAAKLINERMSELQNRFGAQANSEKLLAVIAVEAAVDALQANDNYLKLRTTIDKQLDTLNSHFAD